MTQMHAADGKSKVASADGKADQLTQNAHAGSATHRQAAEAHRKAASTHEKAAIEAVKHGKDDEATTHARAAERHYTQAVQHDGLENASNTRQGLPELVAILRSMKGVIIGVGILVLFAVPFWWVHHSHVLDDEQREENARRHYGGAAPSTALTTTPSTAGEEDQEKAETCGAGKTVRDRWLDTEVVVVGSGADELRESPRQNGYTVEGVCSDILVSANPTAITTCNANDMAFFQDNNPWIVEAAKLGFVKLVCQPFKTVVVNNQIVAQPDGARVEYPITAFTHDGGGIKGK
jgi:hypothetical protein